MNKIILYGIFNSNGLLRHEDEYGDKIYDLFESPDEARQSDLGSSKNKIFKCELIPDESHDYFKEE